MLVLVVALAGCTPGEPDVELGSPEETAESVGRILCAEHEQRVDAIGNEIESTQAIQRAKRKTLADTTAVDAANERLDDFAKFYDANEDKLSECTIVLTDLDTIEPDSRVNLSLKIVSGDWAVDDGELEVVERSSSLVLTMTRLEGDWKVTGSTVDFALPMGALNSLLD